MNQSEDAVVSCTLYAREMLGDLLPLPSPPDSQAAVNKMGLPPIIATMVDALFLFFTALKILAPVPSSGLCSPTPPPRPELSIGRCQGVQLPCENERQGARRRPPVSVAVDIAPRTAGRPHGRYRERVCKELRGGFTSEMRGWDRAEATKSYSCVRVTVASA